MISRSRSAIAANVTLWVSLALIVAVVAVYWRVAGFEFVSLDDPAYVFNNLKVRNGLSWDGVQWAFTTFHKSNWHPLTWLSHMLDSELFGLAPGGPHIVNVALHSINAVLLFLALRLMTDALWPSALAAALFALHPLRVESVAWVAERKDLLGGLFWLATVLLYVWYVRRPAVIRYLLLFASLTLGLMAKPMLVTLPCVLMLLDIWPLGRWRLFNGPDADQEHGERPGVPVAGEPIRRLILEKLPLLGLSLVSSAITVYAQRGGGAMLAAEEIPLWSRLANSLIAYVAYLRKTIWPTDLAAFYPHPALGSVQATAPLIEAAAGAAVLLVGISVLVLYNARRRPYLAVGWFWYLGTLAPVIGIVQVGLQAMADRYLYLPMVGVCIAVAWAGHELASRRPRSRPILIAAAVVWLTACAITTWIQIGTWRDSISLFEHAIAVTRDNYFAHGNLASVLANLGRLDEATVHYESALRIRPNYATALTGLGSIYFWQGKLDQAADHHRRALRLQSDSPVVHTNLGAVLLQQGKLDEAAHHFERALRTHPEYAMAHTNLGALYSRQGRLDQAEAHLRSALRLSPSSASAHINVGKVLLRQGRLSEAATYFEAVLRIQPGHVGARQALEQIRVALGTTR